MPARAETDGAVEWAAAALTTIELPILSLWFVNLTGGKDTQPAGALHGWANMRLKQLDGWLSNRQYIATDDFTVADILMTHVLDAGGHRDKLDSYPHIQAYRARCTERSAWKKTLEAYSKRVEPA